MPWLPFDRRTLVTSLPPMEILDKLQSDTAKAKLWTLTRPKVTFIGSVDSASFSVHRNISYKNSFIPIMRGTLEMAGTSTLIHVRMGLHPLVLIIIAVWLGGVGVAFVAITTSSILKGSFAPWALLPLGMFLFGYGLVMVFFLAERRPSIEALKRVLAAQELP